MPDVLVIAVILAGGLALALLTFGAACDLVRYWHGHDDRVQRARERRQHIQARARNGR